MRALEDALRATAEHSGIALAFDGKAADRHAVHFFGARCELVPPGDVVGGARGEDFDLGVTCESLGDVARVQFGAAVDGRPVPLDDDRELHWSLSECEPPAGD